MNSKTTRIHWKVPGYKQYFNLSKYDYSTIVLGMIYSWVCKVTAQKTEDHKISLLIGRDCILLLREKYIMSGAFESDGKGSYIFVVVCNDGL